MKRPCREVVQRRRRSSFRDTQTKIGSCSFEKKEKKKSLGLTVTFSDVFWTQVSPLIDENTRKKFLIFAGNDYQGPGGLVDYMDKEIIPDFLEGDCMVRGVRVGGAKSLVYITTEQDSSLAVTVFGINGCFPFKCEVPEGGLVPKSLYRTAEELESEETRLLTDSIYKSASIFKGAPFEVRCQLCLSS